MASSFDRWEKDPFFSAAEEVQESADRMESTFRTWVHANKVDSSSWNSEELNRDLRTALGTTKWQLEEFARAVRQNYANNSNEDSRERHREFIVAIEDQVSKIQNSLQEFALLEGKASLPWVRLDDGQRNELALFLSGPSVFESKATTIHHGINNENLKETNKYPELHSLMKSSHPTKWGYSDVNQEKPHWHRRTASANADICILKIAVVDDDANLQSSSNEQPELPPRKIPSVSGFLNTMESASKLKWPKNGFRKWKAMNSQEVDNLLPRSPPLPKGINSCYERSKSCLDCCDNCYSKQLYGWYGTIQSKLQRSQYHMQYSRPVQAVFWILLLCLIVLVGLRAI